MATRIDKLTDAQIARFPEWVDKWVRIGLSTEPANYDAAIEGVRGCYAAAKLKMPKLILRMGSPFGAVVGGPLAVMMLNGVRSQVGSQVRSQVDSQVYSQVGSQVRSQVDSQVRSQVDSQVYSQVYSQVRSQVGSQVRSQVRSQVDSQVSSAYAQYRGGNLWAGWYAYVSFLRDCCGWKNKTLNDFACDEKHALNASWCWYHEDVAAISDRPESLRLNATGQLHSSSSPSIAWRDGWRLWHIDGILVDEQIVMRPETQTIQQINSESNNDIRAIRCERYGWERYLKDSGAKCIDERKHPRDGTPERLYRDPKGDCRVIVVDPSTRKNVVLGVPADVKSCADAQNWMSHGFDAAAMVRT